MTTQYMERSSTDAVVTAIRKEFYALRNGMTADTLRKGGMEQKYIFGLQLPQIKGIAERLRPESDIEAAAVARVLWSDRECREARLTACHMMPPSMMPQEEGTRWAEDAATREEADILAFRLLRYLSYAAEIAVRLSAGDQPLKRYTAEAIRRFI